MKNKFQSFIHNNNLCKNTDRILLGLSGGVDSVCLFHLFRELNYPIAVAHCNFQLRGEESDTDEKFVENLAKEFDIPFFSIRFNTYEIAKEEGISIQMAARDLRYDWFEELRQKYDYNYIAIAHNSDDVVETFLINLTRGSGIKGLTGIKSKHKHVIRPLLFAFRDEILEYINNNHFEFREDSSNKSTKYSRNLLRHDIIPLFEQLNPKFKETIIGNIDKLKDTEIIYKGAIESARQSILVEKDEKFFLSIPQIKDLNPVFTYLYEILKPFGFSSSQVKDIIESLNGISGKKFLSLTHRVIKDRTQLIIEEISGISANAYYIDQDQDVIQKPIELQIKKMEVHGDLEIIPSRKVAQLDMDQLEFPLVLRKWKIGDYFMPLGMNQLKKVSDFFIDQKLSISDKENTWILESNNKIVWILGYRIDERFKITKQTARVYQLSYV